MTVLVDVVNFNADASCVDAQVWLDALAGGERSWFCSWLRMYVTQRRAVVLGLVGATLVDVAHWNPDALSLINMHPDVFDVVLRPFSHDVATLRTPQGFVTNLREGRTVLCVLGQLQPWFLPPEFMLTSQQVSLLAQAGIRGVFINPARFHPDLQKRIPQVPFWVSGTQGSRIKCIPVDGGLTAAYLESLHRGGAQPWNQALLRQGQAGVQFSWRDGESALLIPDGLAREQAWLADEDATVQRCRLRDVVASLVFVDGTPQHYPAHSFHAWSKEMRMMGFLQRVHEQEARLATFTPVETALWLQVINSDVLSSVEKEAPVVVLHPVPPATGTQWNHTIQRSARGFEGEDFLSLLEDVSAGAAHLATGPGAHMEKLRARIKALTRPVKVP